MQLKRTQRKTLERLGIAYTEERIGWRGSKRYGFSPIFALIISDQDAERWQADRNSSEQRRLKAAESRAKAAARREQELCDEADRMGLLRNSRTFASWLRGEIEYDDAVSIGRYMAHRHEATNYDELLAMGWSKEDARACMEEQ